jgi:hypothetical protein
LIDGSFAAYDDSSLVQLWEVNVGAGFNAPPVPSPPRKSSLISVPKA